MAGFDYTGLLGLPMRMAQLPDGSYASRVVAEQGVGLVKGATPCERVTCTDADTDYVAASALPVGTKRLVVYSSGACLVAMGAATSGANGVWVPAGVPVVFPVLVTGVVADDKVHVQSPTAGAVVTFTRLPN